jgi:hypothetical protein
MKSVVAVLLVLVLLTASGVIAAKPVQASSKMWTQTYGGADNDFAYSLAATSDGGYIIVGSTGMDVGSTGGYVWLVKTDMNGYEMWNRTYGSAGKTHGYYVVQTVDGGYALVGSDTSSSDNSDVWLVKTDAEGYEMWNHTYGGTEDENALSLLQTSDGGYVIAGTTSSFDGGPNFWLVKTDAYGHEMWNHTYGGPETDLARIVVATSDGGYAIIGITQSFGAGKMDFWLVKTDADGILQWTHTYGGPNMDMALSVVATGDGGYALVGMKSYSDGFSGSDGWLIKTDSSGNELWNRTYGGPESEAFLSVVQASDGGYVLAGDTSSYGAGSDDFWLVKTDANGNELWNQTYGGPDGDGAYSLVKTPDGGYALVGSTRSFGAGNQDFWLIKTNEYGIVPEAKWVILPLMATATLAILITKKKPHTHPKAT